MGCKKKKVSLAYQHIASFSLHPQTFFCIPKENYRFDPNKYFTCLGG